MQRWLWYRLWEGCEENIGRKYQPAALERMCEGFSSELLCAFAVCGVFRRWASFCCIRSGITWPGILPPALTETWSGTAEILTQMLSNRKEKSQCPLVTVCSAVEGRWQRIFPLWFHCGVTQGMHPEESSPKMLPSAYRAASRTDGKPQALTGNTWSKWSSLNDTTWKWIV